MDLTKRSLSEIPRRTSGRLDFTEAQLGFRIAAANSGKGYAYHQDDAKKDRANAVTVAAGARTWISVDGLGSGSTVEYIDSIPRPETGLPLLENGILKPVEEGDLYLARFGFNAAMIDPGLSNTEQSNEIIVEYDVGGLFDVHREVKAFPKAMDPGPHRRRRGDMSVLSPLVGAAALLAPRLAQCDADIASTVSANVTGEKFITFGVFFAGAPVIANGVGFYITSTTDIQVWAPDTTPIRLSSPTR